MAVALSACGHANKSSDASSGSDDGAPTGNATAEEVAQEQRGSVTCPAKIQTVKAPNTPVDDVVGIRPGMAWNEATNLALCQNPLLVVSENDRSGFIKETYGAKIRQGFEADFAQPRIEMTQGQMVSQLNQQFSQSANGRYIPRVKPGQFSYSVRVVGMPDSERVLSVAREEYYPKGKFPSVKSVLDAMVAKYGQPSSVQDTGNYIDLQWEFDPSGKPIAEEPLLSQCKGDSFLNSAITISPDCGVTVTAQLRKSVENRDLLESTAVASKNGVGGSALIQQTKQDLAKYDASRRASEVKNSDATAAKPTL
jgi:hypothetical protein